MSKSKALTTTYNLEVVTRDECYYAFPQAVRWYVDLDCGFLHVQYLSDEGEYHYMAIATDVIERYKSNGIPLTN